MESGRAWREITPGMWSGLDEGRRAFHAAIQLRQRRTLPVVAASVLTLALVEAAIIALSSGETAFGGGLALFSAGALAFTIWRGTRLGTGQGSKRVSTRRSSPSRVTFLKSKA